MRLSRPSGVGLKYDASAERRPNCGKVGGSGSPSSNSRTRAALVVVLYCAAGVVVTQGACIPRDSSDPLVEVRWWSDPAPVQVGSAIVLVEVADSAGAPISDAHLVLEANMTHPGMRPEVARAKAVGEGLYRAEIEFSMQGDWFMEVAGTTNDGTSFARVFHFSVASPER